LALPISLWTLSFFCINLNTMLMNSETQEPSR
jgi:hypothetical protein